MSTKKVQGKFYPLQHQEFLKLNQILTQSELSVYLWLKTDDPFGGKLIEADTQKIAEDLTISRRTVQRALVKLQQEDLIELVISKFRYRLKSKSAPQSENNSEIKDDSQLTTPGSSDDSEIVSTTPASLQRHQDRLDDSKIALTTPMSPLTLESKIEQEFETPKISKTYIDFKKTLSEDESENFLGFVKEVIKNFQQPINDLEAWLANKTKAGQNRWEVYYPKYQSSQKARKPKSESNLVSGSIEQTAIANYQKQLNQEKTDHRRTENAVSISEFNQLLDNPANQIKRINKLESQPQKISKPLGKYVSEGCEHLRNLRMKSLFSNESIQGGIA